MPGGLHGISEHQRRVLFDWFPDAVIEHDHSWGLTETAVLQVRSGALRYIVKAAPPADKHLAREFQAHSQWLGPWLERGRAPRLAHADPEAGLLATEFVPGHLVLGSQVAEGPDTYRQAGELLGLFHCQASVIDPDYERSANAGALRWLDGPHRIDPGTVRELRRMIASWPTPPATLVPTHGDWQPRNWLWSDGALVAIDFGRVALRPAMTDFARLHVQEFRGNPALEAAFLAGYGSDPRDSDTWFRSRVREAVGTAAWAFVHHDEAFEHQGQEMLAAVPSERGRP